MQEQPRAAKALKRRKKPKIRKPGRKASSTGRLAFWVVLLVVLALGIGIWRLWYYYYGTTPRFNYVLVEKNDSPLKILNGESLKLHPRDKLAIRSISTTLYINYGIRLACTGLDINAFRYGATVFSDLLPAETSIQPQQFRVFVKHFNEDLGYFDIVSEPHIEDWLEKAARIIDKKRKAAFLLDGLNRFPEDRQIRDRLVEAYIAAGQPGEAARLLEKEVEENPKSDTLMELLQLYEKTSNKEGTLAVLKKLVDLNPDQVDFRLQLAQSFEEGGEKKKAIEVYASVLPSLGNEDRLAIHQTLGLLYSETGQPQKAISAYLKALELDQKDANIYYNLSNLYERVGKKDLSDQYLEKALSLKVQDLEGRLKLAESLIEKKRYEEAEKHLNQVLKKDPDSLRAILLMISIMEKTGNKEKMKAFYKKALAQDPDNATLIYNLGMLHYETGELKQSQTYFEKYALLFPKDKDIHSLLFDIYKKNGDEVKAFQEAQVLLQLDRENTEPYDFIFAYLNHRNEYTKIIGIMEKGIGTFPNNTDIRQYLIVAYLKTGQEKKAVDQLVTLLKTKPNDVSLWLQLAQLQEKLGNKRSARRSLEKVLEISPNHKTAKASYLGLLSRQAAQDEEAGRLSEALENYKKILEYDSENEEAQEAYLRLRLKVL